MQMPQTETITNLLVKKRKELSADMPGNNVELAFFHQCHILSTTLESASSNPSPNIPQAREPRPSHFFPLGFKESLNQQVLLRGN